MLDSSIAAVRWLEDSSAVLMARVEDRPTAPNSRGVPLVEDDLSDIVYSVHDVSLDGVEVISGRLTISGAVFDSLQEWDVDSVGHNFRTVLSPHAFPTGGNEYRVEVRWTHVDGRVGFTRWQGPADRVFLSASSDPVDEPTEDSTDYIQSLLDAGGDVVLPAGKYLVDPLDFPANVTSVTGAAPGAYELSIGRPSATTLKLAANAGDGARIFYIRHQVNGNRNVAVSQLVFNMNRYNQGPYQQFQMAHQAAIFATAEDSTGQLAVNVSDVEVYDSAGDGIYVHHRVTMSISDHLSSYVFRGGVVQTGHQSILALADSDLTEASGLDIEPNDDSHTLTATITNTDLEDFDIALNPGCTFTGDNITANGLLYVYSPPGATFYVSDSTFANRYNFRLPNVTFERCVFNSPAATAANVIRMLWSHGSYSTDMTCMLIDCTINGPCVDGIDTGVDAVGDNNLLVLTNVAIDDTTDEPINYQGGTHGTWNFTNVTADGIPVLAA